MFASQLKSQVHFPSQLPAYVNSGRQQASTQLYGSMHSHWRSGRSSWLLTSALSTLGRGGSLESERVDGSSLTHLLCLSNKSLKKEWMKVDSYETVGILMGNRDGPEPEREGTDKDSLPRPWVLRQNLEPHISWVCTSCGEAEAGGKVPSGVGPYCSPQNAPPQVARVSSSAGEHLGPSGLALSTTKLVVKCTFSLI